MRLPRQMHDDNRAEIMLGIRELAKTIREMEVWAAELSVDLSSDKLYIALQAYKKALSNIIEK